MPKQYTKSKMELKHTSIVVVGLCNEEIRLQTLIGVIVFREGKEGKLEPCLISPSKGEDEGSGSNPFRPEFHWRAKGKYGLCFPREAGGHGVLLLLDKERGRYRFMTGINGRDSGSSGPLSNGGPELVDVLDELFGFTSISQP